MSIPRPLVPGQRYKVTVVLNDIAHGFAAGNRIRVAVSTSYWPLVWPSPEPVTLKIFTGASRLELPVREPRAEDAKLRPFAASEGAEPLAKTYHRPSKGRRWIERDIGAGTSTYCIEEDMGRSTIEHIGLETDFVQREVLSHPRRRSPLRRDRDRLFHRHRPRRLEDPQRDPHGHARRQDPFHHRGEPGCL